jgi:hypothetical protein
MKTLLLTAAALIGALTVVHPALAKGLLAHAAYDQRQHSEVLERAKLCLRTGFVDCGR